VLRKGQLVILESTYQARPTKSCSRLEAAASESRHRFHLAFSPERVDPGNRASDEEHRRSSAA
jgi:UDP-N-acetyl-D-mannosaminuronate dehydrogenase